MTISGRVHPSDPLAFYEDLSGCQDMALEELSKVVQHAVSNLLITDINVQHRLQS